MTMEPITIIADTREQLPYDFDNRWVATVRRALPTGDYSVEGFESSIAVERKSIEDYVRSVVQDKDRFKRELARLAEYSLACVVVEAGLPDVLLARYPSGAHPHSVFGATVSICVDHGVPVYFCGDRQTARKFTQEYLLRGAKQLRRECKQQETNGE